MKKRNIILLFLILSFIGLSSYSQYLAIPNHGIQEQNEQDNDMLSMLATSGLSIPYHVTSITELGATGPSIGDQLKYDDGETYRITRSTTSQLKYWDYLSIPHSSSYTHVEVSGNPYFGMLTKDDDDYYYHRYYGNLFVSSIVTSQIFTVTLGTTWMDNYYLTGYKLDYNVSWTIGNDNPDNAWSRFDIYSPNTIYFPPDWSTVVDDPLIVNGWTDSYIQDNFYPYDNVMLNYYLDSNGALKFRFVERTYDNRLFQNPTTYLKWDYWSLTIDCIDRNNNQPAKVELNFGDATLDGETIYNVYFQGGPSGYTPSYGPKIDIIINEGEIFHSIENLQDTEVYTDVAVEKIEVSLRTIDGYRFALSGWFDYFYLRKVTSLQLSEEESFSSEAHGALGTALDFIDEYHGYPSAYYCDIRKLDGPYDGHEHVLNIRDAQAGLYTSLVHYLDNPASQGKMEFKFNMNPHSGGTTDQRQWFQLRAADDTIGVQVRWDMYDGLIQYYTGSSWVTLVTGLNTIWYEATIEYDCFAGGRFSFSIREEGGNLLGSVSNVPFQNSITTIDEIYMGSGTSDWRGNCHYDDFRIYSVH